MLADFVTSPMGSSKRLIRSRRTFRGHRKFSKVSGSSFCEISSVLPSFKSILDVDASLLSCVRTPAKTLASRHNSSLMSNNISSVSSVSPTTTETTSVKSEPALPSTDPSEIMLKPLYVAPRSHNTINNNVLLERPNLSPYEKPINDSTSQFESHITSSGTNILSNLPEISQLKYYAPDVIENKNNNIGFDSFHRPCFLSSTESQQKVVYNCSNSFKNVSNEPSSKPSLDFLPQISHISKASLSTYSSCIDGNDPKSSDARLSNISIAKYNSSAVESSPDSILIDQRSKSICSKSTFLESPLNNNSLVSSSNGIYFNSSTILLTPKTEHILFSKENYTPRIINDGNDIPCRSISAPDLYRINSPMINSIDDPSPSSSDDSDHFLLPITVETSFDSNRSDSTPTQCSTCHSNNGGFRKARKRRRTRSLNAPSPIQQFGPCGRIMKNQAMVMTIQDPASQRLTWYKPPLTVLVIKKIRDASVLQPFVQLVTWLIKEKRMLVFVEQSVLEDPLLLGNSDFDLVKDKLKTFKDGKDDLTDKIDFIVCLGGDGTLLYASLLFQQSVPPVMAFHLGSLGFLTPFQFDNFQEQVTNVLEGHAALTLRSRLRCIIVRRSEDGNRNSKPPTNLLVLNEVVIDRGPSPYLSNIDLFLDGKHITSVQGDGLIVSTPTGSTAYAVAAGASMIHPSVPAIMVTPICPHSLSFRPIVVPAGVELKISVSPDSRNTSWVSFDGRNRQELLHGDSLRVTTSIYPVPSICAQDQISDWFDSLAECLHWNVRKRQKHLDELSDLTHSSSNDTLNSFERESDHISDT